MSARIDVLLRATSAGGLLDLVNKAQDLADNAAACPQLQDTHECYSGTNARTVVMARSVRHPARAASSGPPKSTSSSATLLPW